MTTTTNLIQCKTCAREVSKNAATCPHCGEKIKRGSHPLAIILMALIIAWLLFAMLSN